MTSKKQGVLVTVLLGPIWRSIPITLLTVAMLIMWQFIVQVLDVPLYVLPPPTLIFRQIVADISSGLIFPHLWTTLIEVLFGFFLATAIGVIGGTIIGLSPIAERFVFPFVLGFQAIPKVALAPLLLIWFGFGIHSKIVTAAIIAFYPVLVNVITSLKTGDPRRLLLMRALGANGAQTFLKVRLPGMLPFLFAGMEVAIVFSIIGAIVGEFIGSSVGLGSVILQRQAAVDVAGVFSVLVLLSVMGIVLAGILKMIFRRCAFWALLPQDQ